MKKNYTKPSLRTELFAVEEIMTEVQTVSALNVTDLTLNGTVIEAGTITLSGNNRLQAIKWSDFNTTSN